MTEGENKTMATFGQLGLGEGNIDGVPLIAGYIPACLWVLNRRRKEVKGRVRL